MKFQGIYFDLDGVLVDSMSYHCQAWQTVFFESGVQVSREMILMNEGALGEDILKDWFNSQGHKIDSTIIYDLFKKQRSLFMENFVHQVRLYPQAIDLLNFLCDKKIPLGLVTSSPLSLVQQMIPREILAYFQAVVTQESVNRHKPYPDPYLAAQKILFGNHHRGLAIENAPPGIQSALTSGLACYALTTTLGEDNLKAANRVFSNLNELLHYFLQVSSE
jgi:beta-phosphoglucomutase